MSIEELVELINRYENSGYYDLELAAQLGMRPIPRSALIEASRVLQKLGCLSFKQCGEIIKLLQIPLQQKSQHNQRSFGVSFKRQNIQCKDRTLKPPRFLSKKMM